MRDEITKSRLQTLMKELARSAPKRRSSRVYLTGGGTAVYLGWRKSSVDVDLCADSDDVFREIQDIKQLLNANIEFARPDDFVPPLTGSEHRHIFIEKIGPVSFYHFDPYAQALSKIVRGFPRDLDDARNFLNSGWVDPQQFRTLVKAIPNSAYSKYPNLSREGMESAVEQFLSEE